MIVPRSILGASRRPDITFHRSGRIDISAGLVRRLDINEGDVIDVAEYYGEYYLYVRHRAAEVIGRHEAQCRRTNRCGRCLRAYSRRLCKALLALTKGEESEIRMPAGEMRELVTLGRSIALITRNNIRRQDNEQDKEHHV